MGYEDAPSTKMIATHCAICGRPLRDAVSVERGVGPDCAKKYGIDEAQGPADWAAATLAMQSFGSNDVAWGADTRIVVNALVHRIACEQGSELAARCAAAIWYLGFQNLVLAIASHRTSAIKGIVVRKEDFGFGVEAPYNEAAVNGFRKLGGRWVKENKYWIIPRPQRVALWQVFRACYPKGTLVIGERALIL